jgi:hypothetical protein
MLDASRPGQLLDAEIFTFTALMFGPSAAGVVAIKRPLSTQLVDETIGHAIPVQRVGCRSAYFVSARAFFALGHSTPLAAAPAVIIDQLGPLTVFAVLYFVLNTSLVAFAVALAGRQAPWRIWRTHFMSLWPGYVGGALAAGLTLFLVSAKNGDLGVLAVRPAIDDSQ